MDGQEYFINQDEFELTICLGDKYILTAQIID